MATTAVPILRVDLRGVRGWLCDAASYPSLALHRVIDVSEQIEEGGAGESHRMIDIGNLGMERDRQNMISSFYSLISETGFPYRNEIATR